MTMEKRKSARYLADIIINIVIVISTVLATVLYFFGGPDNLGSQGVDCFKYFTTDSNIVAAVASLLYIMVIVVKRWNDWYGFTFGGRFGLAPVAIVGMLLITLAIAMVERWIRNKKVK